MVLLLVARSEEGLRRLSENLSLVNRYFTAEHFKGLTAVIFILEGG
jgi:hypothetical protein